MTDFLDSLFKNVVGFAAWLWNGLAPPKTKPWCAVFYFVAQEGTGLAYPEPTLEPKLAEAVAAVKLAASAVKDDVYVVYRTIPADALISDPEAKVVSFLGPETGSVFFPDCYDQSTLLPVDTGKDLTCFLKWVYRWCPAEHYAVFIWGHSFGPAGLFEPGNVAHFPAPGLAFLREAFEQFALTRAFGASRDQPPRTVSTDKDTSSSAPPGSDPSDPTSTIQGIAEFGPKIDIVLFEDCWMSTLETTFELAAVVDTVVASQSLLPIGTHYADFVWPYGDLLLNLLSPTYPDLMAHRLVQFYRDHSSQITGLTTVPVALLDLAAVPDLVQPVAALVTALKHLDQSTRNKLVEKGRICQLDQTVNPVVPKSGDGALLDIPTLCQELKLVSGSVGQAAGDLEKALPALIKLSLQSDASPGSAPVFAGVSAFHWPPPGNDSDTFITAAVNFKSGSYKNLALVKNTAWDQLALEYQPHPTP